MQERRCNRRSRRVVLLEAVALVNIPMVAIALVAENINLVAPVTFDLVPVSMNAVALVSDALARDKLVATDFVFVAVVVR